MSGSDQTTASYRTIHVVAVVASFFILWQLAVILFKPPAYLLPSPVEIFQEFFTAPSWFLSHSAQTLGATLIGFGIALALGCVAAVAIVYSRVLENTLYTLLVALNSVPKIALAPLFVIWVGSGIEAKIAISFLIAIFAIVVDTVLGLRSVDPDAVDLFRSMHASTFQTLYWLRMPNALPHLFAGMKLAISLALVGTISGEFVASQSGLGYVILAGQGTLETARVFVAIVLLGLIGTVLFFIVEALDRLICPWHVSHRSRYRGQKAKT